MSDMTKYLIVQTDDEDFYVKCPSKDFWNDLYGCVPITNEICCVHGSEVPEGRELTPGISRELFNRDVVAVANGTEQAPWNLEVFKERIKESISPDNLYDCGDTLYVQATKNPETKVIIATKYNLFCGHFFMDCIVSWKQVMDSNVNFAIRTAKQWIEENDAGAWDIDRYYCRLLTVFSNNAVVRDENVPHPYKNVFHDYVKIKCANGEEFVVADEDRVVISNGTYCPWSLVTTKQIKRSVEHIRETYHI